MIISCVVMHIDLCVTRETVLCWWESSPDSVENILVELFLSLLESQTNVKVLLL